LSPLFSAFFGLTLAVASGYALSFSTVERPGFSVWCLLGVAIGAGITLRQVVA
jgi:hypothetical protein